MENYANKYSRGWETEKVVKQNHIHQTGMFSYHPNKMISFSPKVDESISNLWKWMKTFNNVWEWTRSQCDHKDSKMTSGVGNFNISQSVIDKQTKSCTRSTATEFIVTSWSYKSLRFHLWIALSNHESAIKLRSRSVPIFYESTIANDNSNMNVGQLRR